MNKLWDVSGAILGMVHVRALPGTPRYGGDWKAVEKKAREEAELLEENGVDGIILENMHDAPYLNRDLGPEITAAMTGIAAGIKAQASIPLGIQILAGANKEALAVALAADLDFVRAEGFVFGHLADEGYMDAQAGELLRYRRQMGADHIQVWTDLKKKHSSHALTADVDIVEMAHAAHFFGADALIVTGSATGHTADSAEAKAVRAAIELPVVIGSGITAENLPQYFDAADAFIVGSALKYGGKWNQEIDPARVEALVRRATELRSAASV